MIILMFLIKIILATQTNFKILFNVYYFIVINFRLNLFQGLKTASGKWTINKQERR